MATEFDARIKFKRDTSSNWTSNNPKLLNGEIILVDTDSGELRAKVGDGVKSYTQLPFSDEVVRNLIPTDLSELNQDSTHRLVTDSEKQTWNNKSDFDGDYYSLTSRPSIPTQLSQLSSDSTHRLVTDTEKNIWNNKSDFNDIPTRLSQLSQDSAHRLVTDSEKQTWNNKSDFDGDYYSLTSRPSIPTQLSQLSSDSTHRTVTDTEKNIWNNKSDFNGNYNNLTNKPTIPTQLSQLSSDTTHRTVTDTEKQTWNNKMDELSAQTITLTTSGWTQGSDDRYYQTKSVSGVTSSTPVVWVDCDLSTSDVDAKIEILTAWAGPSANEVKQGSGTLTFYSYEKPTVNIPVNVGVG